MGGWGELVLFSKKEKGGDSILLLFLKEEFLSLEKYALDMVGQFKKGQIPWNKGKELSDEHRKKLSEAHIGKTPWNKGKEGVFSEENKKKHSAFMKEYYKHNKHSMLGKKQSEESIRRAVESRNITISNPEVRKRLSEAHKGQIAWNKGKVMSKEIRKKMHRITIEEMQKIAESRGGKCLSKEYNGSGNNLRWKCEKDHEWEATPHNIKKDKWCPICSTRIGEKICRGYFEAFFKEKFPKNYPSWMRGFKGKNLELDGYCRKLGLAFEYQGEQHYKPNHYFNRNFSLEKIKQHDELKKQKCLENGVTLIQVPHHTDYKKLGNWIEEECKKRGFNPLVNSEKIDYSNFNVYSSKNLEEMQEIAKNNGGKCLSKNYINISTELEWQCKEGHIWKAKPHDIKRGTWCPVCSIERAKSQWNNQFGDAFKFQENELNILRNLSKMKGGECLSDRYVNNATKLKWKCKEGHIWEAKSGNIKSGKWCPKCSYEYRASLRRGNIEEMRKIAESRGGKCLSEKFVNVDTKLRWQCKKGHIWEAVPSSIKRGSWCARCVKGKQEKVAKELS